MKKTLALVLALVLMSACLLACSSGSSEPVEIPGTWNLSKAKASGITLPASQLGFEMSFTFNEDGSATMLYDGETTDGLTWKQDGDVIKLGAYGYDLYDLAFDGKTLTLHEDSEDVDLIFSK